MGVVEPVAAGVRGGLAREAGVDHAQDPKPVGEHVAGLAQGRAEGQVQAGGGEVGDRIRAVVGDEG